MLEDLARRATGLCADRRAILGIVGAPGAGKSTLAERLVAMLDPDGSWVARLPMDGYHLADAALSRLGRLERKGAIDTFDGYGYLATLRRLRVELDNVVYAPDFERTLEQPLAGSIGIGPEVRLVVTEGNYLLSSVEPWTLVRAELDEVWFTDLQDDVRRDRLTQRHVRFGKGSDEARRWVETVDQPNAVDILRTRERADLWVDMQALD